MKNNLEKILEAIADGYAYGFEEIIVPNYNTETETTEIIIWVEDPQSNEMQDPNMVITLTLK
jgi:hypothetical protein